MSKVNSLLSQRTKKRGDSSRKMAALAQKSASGELSSLSGMLGGAILSESEEEALKELLARYGEDREEAWDTDFHLLRGVTCEVKAINHQAALLHGERIQRAQDILLNYAEGAFSAWLISTYGNRQTPYNFLQYYLFYQKVPVDLRPRLEEMPRQAIYSLASRQGDFETKQEIVASYTGESKQELIERIRDTFPLSENDKRRQNTGELVLGALQKASDALARRRTRIGSRQRAMIRDYLDLIESLIE
jgi:hypothetical protein